MNTVPDCLHLNIISMKCTCGNKWTHSHPWLSHSQHGYLGGTPTPQQEHKLPCTSYENSQWNVSHCFRCVPLALGVGWTRPQVASSPKPKALTYDQKAIEDELLS